MALWWRGGIAYEGGIVWCDECPCELPAELGCCVYIEWNPFYEYWGIWEQSTALNGALRWRAYEDVDYPWQVSAWQAATGGNCNVSTLDSWAQSAAGVLLIGTCCDPLRDFSTDCYSCGSSGGKPRYQNAACEEF